jgi:hypothetical protein
MVEAPATLPNRGVWQLRGVISNERYTERDERDLLVARQQGLGRPEATRAALIPIKKTEAWWALAQDERRAIFEAPNARFVDMSWSLRAAPPKPPSGVLIAQRRGSGGAPPEWRAGALLR